MLCHIRWVASDHGTAAQRDIPHDRLTSSNLKLACADAALRHMSPVLAASAADQSRTLRPAYGCIAALHDHCAASPTAHSLSGKACPTSLPQELCPCLPEVLLFYAAVKAGHTVQSAQDLLPTEGDRAFPREAHEPPNKAALGVSPEQLSQYPDCIVYDLLAYQPDMMKPFVEGLIALPSIGSLVPSEGAVGRNAFPSYGTEEWTLLGLLMGQKVVQHEKLRSASLLGTVSPRSMVSALLEASASASTLAGSAVAAARQKLLTLQEIHLGAT